MQAISYPVPQQGYDSISPAVSLPNLGYSGSALDANWAGSIQLPDGNYNESPDFPTNTTISYSYAIYPWADKTHEYIQPGMLTFVSKHLNQKYKLYNMAPIWKINIESRMHFHRANDQYIPQNNAELTEFKKMLKTHGEDALFLRNTDSQDLKAFRNLAVKAEYRYLTKFGILSHWNFCGAVLSKGESTGPATFLDMHQDTDQMFVVGCALGERARVANIWGRVQAGSKLFLILRRVRTLKQENGEFQFVAYASRERDYPPSHLTTYMDDSGRRCRAFVLCIGTCTESFEREPSSSQIELNAGHFGTVQQAYESYGTAPHIIVQLGI